MLTFDAKKFLIFFQIEKKRLWFIFQIKRHNVWDFLLNNPGGIKGVEEGIW